MPEEQKSNTQPQAPQAQLVINAAQAGIQFVYANGSLINMSPSDIQIIFAMNGRSIIGTALGLPAAKTLLNGLKKAIDDYERKTEMSISDNNHIAEMLKKP